MDTAEGDLVRQLEPGMPPPARCPKREEKFLARPRTLTERLVEAYRAVMPRVAGLAESSASFDPFRDARR
jgi:hypothetical protein